MADPVDNHVPSTSSEEAASIPSLVDDHVVIETQETETSVNADNDSHSSNTTDTSSDGVSNFIISTTENDQTVIVNVEQAQIDPVDNNDPTSEEGETSIPSPCGDQVIEAHETEISDNAGNDSPTSNEAGTSRYDTDNEQPVIVGVEQVEDNNIHDNTSFPRNTANGVSRDALEPPEVLLAVGYLPTDSPPEQDELPQVEARQEIVQEINDALEVPSVVPSVQLTEAPHSVLESLPEVTARPEASLHSSSSHATASLGVTTTGTTAAAPRSSQLQQQQNTFNSVSFYEGLSTHSADTSVRASMHVSSPTGIRPSVSIPVYDGTSVVDRRSIMRLPVRSSRSPTGSGTPFGETLRWAVMLRWAVVLFVVLFLVLTVLFLLIANDNQSNGQEQGGEDREEEDSENDMGLKLGNVFVLLAKMQIPTAYFTLYTDVPDYIFRSLEYLLNDPGNEAAMGYRLQQRYALAAFYFATTEADNDSPVNNIFLKSDKSYSALWPIEGEGHTNRYNECTWTGVSCNEVRQVTSLSLTQVQLKGSVPRELFLLSNLELLRLRGNRLEGTIPTEISHLVGLSSLDLANNNFVGELFDRLSPLSKLEFIDVCSNFFTGELHMGNLTNLEKIFIDDNAFEGKIEVDMGKMTRLAELTAAENKLNGTLPIQAGKISTTLRKINLSFNHMSGSLPSVIGNLSNTLEQLYLGDNNFNGTLPTEIGKLTHAQILSLESNSFEGTLPSELGELYGMRFLYLEGNSFKGFLPREIGRLTDLNVLRVHENEFNGTMPEEICRVADLSSLSIYADCKEIVCECCNACF